LSEFAERVRAVVAALPEGDVVTYGEVAAMAGKPGAARGAGAVLASSDGTLPWWRVVYASGRLAPGKEVVQARRLRAEGVDVDRTTGRVRLAAVPRRQ
jgi:methylated-DNA-protein-cysteine methyltransferase-like protein